MLLFETWESASSMGIRKKEGVGPLTAVPRTTPLAPAEKNGTPSSFYTLSRHPKRKETGPPSSSPPLKKTGTPQRKKTGQLSRKRRPSGGFLFFPRWWGGGWPGILPLWWVRECEKKRRASPFHPYPHTTVAYLRTTISLHTHPPAEKNGTPFSSPLQLRKNIGGLCLFACCFELQKWVFMTKTHKLNDFFNESYF